MRARVALLVEATNRLAPSFPAGGTLELFRGSSGPSPEEAIPLAPGLDVEALHALFRAPPLDDVAVAIVTHVGTAERLRLGDAGVDALGTSASPARALEVGRLVVELGGRFGDHPARRRIRVLGEEWDVPAGAPLLWVLELLGAQLDRDALCMADECDECRASIRLSTNGTADWRRTCRLPTRGRMEVLETGKAIRCWR